MDQGPSALATTVVDPLTLVLATHEGSTRIDAEIRAQQARVCEGAGADAALEGLGWLFVAKARESFDAGFYKLAEQCALVLDGRRPGSAEALLLRGHALQSQHRFREAEALARKLVQERGLPFDLGLLGDILVDRGRVDEAAEAYQAMLDLKPDPQGYARAAHIRWLKGDVAGAIELMRMAARGASPRDAESAAWMHTQLARYLWQSQSNDEAVRALDLALELQPAYAPALLLRGRMLLAHGSAGAAVHVLRAAARSNPLPEYLWVLSEALRANEQETEAQEVESTLERTGSSSDPRTYALFLAGRAGRGAMALSLAEGELRERADIFTHDALGWTLAAVGRDIAAREEMKKALAHGTMDARVFFHAALIAARCGESAEARAWLKKLQPLIPLLLPSERQRLETMAATVTGTNGPAATGGFSRL